MGLLSVAGKMACIDIYDPIPGGAFDRIYRVGESVVGTKFDGLVFHWVHQGTRTVEGWEADFDCIPKYHGVLGNLHSGFDENNDALIAQITPNVPKGAVINVYGHSKGAGEGSIMACKLKLAGFNVGTVVLFACPNSMYERGAQWFQSNFTNYVSFRNMSREIPELGDPVPSVPLAPYVAPVKHNLVCVPPKGLSALLPTAWHHGDLYYAAVKDL